LSKDMEKLRRTYHMLKMAWRISFATLFIGIFILALLGSEFAVQLGIYTIISSTVGLALSTFLLENKKLTFYMAGLIEKPPESIMKVIVVEKICGKGEKAIERTLDPPLQPCISRQPVCHTT